MTAARTLALEYLKMAKLYGPPMAFGNTTIDDAIAALEAETGESVEPIDCQFQGPDGRWHSFLNDEHKDATIASGKWPIRNLYTAPPSAVPKGWQLVTICMLKQVTEALAARLGTNAEEWPLVLSARNIIEDLT